MEKELCVLSGQSIAQLERYAMKNVVRTAFASGVVFLLAACPKETSFVEHYTDHLQVPDTLCVLQRLQSIAAGNSVQHIEDRIALGNNHRFQFEVGTVLHSFAVLVQADNSASVRHTAWAPNHSVGELQRAERSITEVERALFGRCELRWETMQQSCQGRSCSAFAATPRE